MRRPSRRVTALGALWLAISGAALLFPGCYGNNCTGGFQVYGVDAGEGMMVDENTWATGPVDGQWLWFPRQRVYFFEIPSFGGRWPYNWQAHLSGAAAEPVKTNAEIANGAGNIALVSGLGPNHINLRNDTCSDYYLHFVVEARPVAPLTPTEDGLDAGIPDAAEPNDGDAGDDAGDASDAAP